MSFFLDKGTVGEKKVQPQFTSLKVSLRKSVFPFIEVIFKTCHVFGILVLDSVKKKQLYLLLENIYYYLI